MAGIGRRSTKVVQAMEVIPMPAEVVGVVTPSGVVGVAMPRKGVEAEARAGGTREVLGGVFTEGAGTTPVWRRGRC